MSFGVYLTSWLVLGFLAGSVPFGFIVAKLRGVDIRTVGSGNIGMTNVWRVCGWPYGVTVMILDILKGLVPLISLALCLPYSTIADNPGLIVTTKMLTGLAAVLGHTFTPWLKFKGGKGVATAGGVLIGLYQAWVLVPVGIFLVLALATRYVSVGSLVAALSVAVLSFTVPALKPLWPLGLLAAVLVCWTHRSNIKRLLDGTENRFGSKPPQDQPDKTEEQP
jgi:glycerol-3-phosphate acyltransferase PlsY